MSIRRENLGTMPDGREVHCFELKRGKVTARILDLGAAVQALYLPDRQMRSTGGELPTAANFRI